MRSLIISVCTMFVFLTGCNEMQNKNLPKGFVYLTDVDSSIIESTRYFGSENFIGKTVPGYVSSRIILTKEAAQALKNVQAELKTYGFKLVVYDGYRPQRAVNAFIKWSADATDQINKQKYYPTINKADAFKLGYIAEKSGHSRGSTVDLSIIPINAELKPITLSNRKLTDGSIIPFLDDGTVDMGSSFDLFHPASNHDSQLVNKSANNMRNFLRKIMKKHGFKELHEEWWHYTLVNEPYPDTYFNWVNQ